MPTKLDCQLNFNNKIEKKIDVLNKRNDERLTAASKVHVLLYKLTNNEVGALFWLWNEVGTALILSL